MVLIFSHLFLVCWFIVFPSVCVCFHLLLWCIIAYFSVPFYSVLSLPQFLLDSSFIIIIYGLSFCSLPSFVELNWYSRTHGIISWITVSTVKSFKLFALMPTAVLPNNTKLMACVYHVVWWSCSRFVFSIEVHFQCWIHLHVRYSVGAHLPSSCLQPSSCLCTSTVKQMMIGSYCSGGDICRHLATAVATRQMLISANERNPFLTFSATDCVT